MAAEPSSRLRFGPFVCDIATGELSKNGRDIRLQDQPRQILVALLERPGTLVTRDDLRHRLWPDGTFVDFDNSLNVGVRKIRDALGDAAPARYIETVRGIGYRFIAPVEIVNSPDQAPRPVDVPVASVARWPRWQVGVVAAGVVVLLVLASFITQSSATGERDIESLAVIPFTNLLGDDARQYLVDGLTDAVTTELAARTRVRVIASQSVFAMRDRQMAPAEFASRWGVDAVLVGSVARSGAAGFVVNVRMMDAASDRVRWAGRFERTATEDLANSSDIIEALAHNVLRLTTEPASAPRAPILPEAREAYLRGRFFWAKRGQANSIIAVGHLSRAIQLQPAYSEAWSGLAHVYAVYEGGPSPVIVPWPGDGIAAGIYAAQQALRLSPDFGEAHAALGKLYVQQRRWGEAEQSLRRAVDLSPQYSTARQWLGTMYGRLRRCDEALTQVEIGAKLDPLTALVNEAVGSVYLSCNEPQRAIAIFEEVLKMHPDSRTTQHQLGRALSELGRFGEAIRLLEGVHSPGDQTLTTVALIRAYVKVGRREDAIRLEAGLANPYLRAAAAASLGHTPQMWEWLELSLSKNAGGLQNLLVQTELEPFHDSPRFIDFAQRAGFPVPIPPGRFSRLN